VFVFAPTCPTPNLPISVLAGGGSHCIQCLIDELFLPTDCNQHGVQNFPQLFRLRGPVCRHFPLAPAKWSTRIDLPILHCTYIASACNCQDLFSQTRNFPLRESQKKEICARISRLREKACGARGKSAFAKKLGLSPSTYDYYESGRVPSADILVAIADLAEVDLRWLITGVEPIGASVPSQHPLVLRAAQLMKDKPDAAPALAAFLDLLSQAMELRFADPVVRKSDEPRKPARIGKAKGERHAAWIPVLGRTAAGVPVFWSAKDGEEGVTRMAELIERYAGKTEGDTRQGHTAGTEASPPSTVQVVTVRDSEDAGPVEFVSCEPIKRRWPDAFAVRVDGESMTPEISNGDLVVLSPSAPAEDGKPAVLQLQSQIGVTCKIYRRQGQSVNLTAINEQFAPQKFPISSVQWAFRVLARVRPEPSH